MNIHSFMIFIVFLLFHASCDTHRNTIEAKNRNNTLSMEKNPNADHNLRKLLTINISSPEENNIKIELDNFTEKESLVTINNKKFWGCTS